MNLTYTTGAHGSRHSGGQLHFDEGVTVVETVILRGCFSTRISDNDCRAVGYLKLFFFKYAYVCDCGRPGSYVLMRLKEVSLRRTYAHTRVLILYFGIASVTMLHHSVLSVVCQSKPSNVLQQLCV